MEHRDVIIIGGGFAGAATAFWLKASGVASVTILEREPLPGSQASGKNAGIARQGIPEAPLAILAARSVSFIRHPPASFCEHPIMEQTGGFLISRLPKDPRLEQIQKNALAAGVFTYPADRVEVLQRAPMLQDAPFLSALACPGDGLVDIHSLLTSFLRGVEVVTDAPVTAFRVGKHKVKSVETPKGAFSAERFVNASGAWASSVAAMAGARPIVITPKRRHLLHTGPIHWADPRSPYIWSVDPAVYFRPESGGLLLSPCDEAVAEPGTPPSDPEAPAWLAERLCAAFPYLANLPVAKFWAQLRSSSPDGAFVIGQDPALHNFFWAAGLGGHGMTTSAAVGELAAALITGATPPVDPAPFDPRRFGG